MAQLLCLKQVRIIDTATGLVRELLDVVISDGEIQDVCESASPLSEGVMEIDCHGQYAIPGFFDCHTHLAALTNQPPEVEREIFDECQLRGSFEEGCLARPVLQDFVRRGITQVRDLGGPVHGLQGMKPDRVTATVFGPDILYAGPMLEMPPLTGAEMNERWPGWTVAIDSAGSAEEVVASLVESGVSCLKVFGRFEDEVLESFVSRAAEAGLPVACDPGRTFFHDIDIRKGIRLGVRCFEHAKSLWYSVLKDDLKDEHDRLRTAGPEERGRFAQRLMELGSESISISALDELADAMLVSRTLLCPTLHVCKFFSEKPEVFNDQEPEKFRPAFATLFEVGRVIVGRLAECGVPMLVGQDGYIPRFTHEEMNLLSENGLSPAEILRGATIYPAEWLGLTEMYGSIETGKKANLVILDANPIEDIRNTQNVGMVILDGQIVYQSERFH